MVANTQTQLKTLPFMSIVPRTGIRLVAMAGISACSSRMVDAS